MGFRLSKRVKILPGVTLNLSKSGVSISAGVRGAKVTVGKNGVRQTVGIPGTGLSHTTYTKYGNNSAPKTSYSSSASQPQANISPLGALLIIRVPLLIILAMTKPSLIPVLLLASAIYFVWKKYNKNDAGIRHSGQSSADNYIINAELKSSAQSPSDDSIIKITCTKCEYSFDVKKERIPDVGRDFTCPKCLNCFFAHSGQENQQIDAIDESARPMVKF